MKQSTILINAALIIVKMVFTLMNERSAARSEGGQKSLTDSASGILLTHKSGSEAHSGKAQKKAAGSSYSDDKTVAVAGEYAYINTGRSLVIYNVGDPAKPTQISETIF